MTIRRTLAAPVLAAALLATAPAPVAAQSLNDLSKIGGGMLSGQSSSSSSSGGSLLSGLSSGSTSLASPQNTAGALAYCQQQGYAPDTATTVKDRLLSKIGGQPAASQDSGYLSGLSGILQAGDGGSFDLSKLKGVIGRKVCGAIADRAVSSFLGG
ncbi:hypothetical protein GCM10017083_23570 [Thalassobaculum fulvum]|uniref:DUF2501 domain-containing protein n=1 Tax=Thalassobaculum fulvum TaxID=1633335 RepID=A0A919CPI0_9PROT|nr:DUF2501 domain-containing protein [Thalassobaculum fulvum]GHD50383.1 hypothetical protein GCM10017083_23570 [Thalassobaculum fulvum]